MIENGELQLVTERYGLREKVLQILLLNDALPCNFVVAKPQETPLDYLVEMANSQNAKVRVKLDTYSLKVTYRMSWTRDTGKEMSVTWQGEPRRIDEFAKYVDSGRITENLDMSESNL